MSRFTVFLSNHYFPVDLYNINDIAFPVFSQGEIHKKMSEVFGSTTSMSGTNLFKGSTQSLLGNARLRMADSHMQMLRPPTMPKPSDRTWRVHVTHVC